MRFIKNYFFAVAALAAILVCPVLADDGQEESSGVVSEHGWLSVSDAGCLVDEQEMNFQLQGISTHNPVWFPDYFCEETMTELVDNFNINVIRLAMYTDDTDGYAVADDVVSQDTRDLILTCIDTAIDLDIYVIVDWHILSDGDPNTYKSEALDFFSDLSAHYSDCPNVLYEICNEPNGDVSWDSIKSYSADVIEAIRQNSPDSVIIVGTPNWSQDVDVAAQSPLDYDNLLYSLHFYAATHGEELQSKLVNALSSGLPVFVSEFGISEASGTGQIDTDSADDWITLLDYYNIGYVYWNLSNKDESSALLNPDCTSLSGWTYSDLSASGQWFYDLMNRGASADVSIMETDAASESPTTLAYSYDGNWVFSNNCSVTVSSGVSWADSNYQYASYDVTVTNSGSSDISNWRLRLTWNTDITPKEYWSCDIGGSGTSRVFVPADYNATIPSGSSIQFGIVVYSAETPTLISVAFEN